MKLNSNSSPLEREHVKNVHEHFIHGTSHQFVNISVIICDLFANFSKVLCRFVNINQRNDPKNSDEESDCEFKSKDDGDNGIKEHIVNS